MSDQVAAAGAKRIAAEPDATVVPCTTCRATAGAPCISDLHVLRHSHSARQNSANRQDLTKRGLRL